MIEGPIGRLEELDDRGVHDRAPVVFPGASLEDEGNGDRLLAEEADAVHRDRRTAPGGPWPGGIPPASLDRASVRSSSRPPRSQPE